MTAIVSAVLAVGFDLNAIASIGSAVALVVFSLVGIGHMRIREETGARASILVLGILGSAIVLVLFIPTLLEEPLTVTAIVFILVECLLLNFIWKRSRGSSPDAEVPATPS